MPASCQDSDQSAAVSGDGRGRPGRGWDADWLGVGPRSGWLARGGRVGRSGARSCCTCETGRSVPGTVVLHVQNRSVGLRPGRSARAKWVRRTPTGAFCTCKMGPSDSDRGVCTCKMGPSDSDRGVLHVQNGSVGLRPGRSARAKWVRRSRTGAFCARSAGRRVPDRAFLRMQRRPAGPEPGPLAHAAQAGRSRTGPFCACSAGRPVPAPPSAPARARPRPAPPLSPCRSAAARPSARPWPPCRLRPACA